MRRLIRNIPSVAGRDQDLRQVVFALSIESVGGMPVCEDVFGTSCWYPEMSMDAMVGFLRCLWTVLLESGVVQGAAWIVFGTFGWNL